jgi:asparaginyl-tRNA synthetase
LETNADDLAFLNEREKQEDQAKPTAERNELSLIDRLNFVISNDFQRLTYTEAIEVLKNSTPYKKKKFKYPVNGELICNLNTNVT